MSRSLSPMILLPVAAAGQDAGTAGDAHSRLNHNLPFRAEQHIDSRSELDHAHPLTHSDLIPSLLAEDDAAGDQAGDLFEDHGRAAARHRDHVLFVVFGTNLAAGNVEASLLVTHIADGAGNRRPVYMYIEDVEKNGNAVESGALRFRHQDLAVRRRDRYRADRDGTLRVAKEVEAEERENPGRNRECGTGQPGDQSAGGEERSR